MHLFYVTVILSLCLASVRCMEFDMQDQVKCIFEEINKNVIVVGDYKAFTKNNVDQPVLVNVKVEDPHATLLNEAFNVSEGQFAFTTKSAGEYKACFTTADMKSTRASKIKLDWKTGVAARDWDSIAKKEHLDALALELRKLEDNIREVYSDLLQLQQREQEMRDISEDTNTRVAWYSIYSLLICVASGVWQLWYLRKFFQRKKLL